MSDAIGMVSRAASGTDAASAGAGSGLTGLGDRDTFLKLLVAQVQNQDPLNPQEPVEFVSQLTQFSQLETLLSMRTSLDTLVQGMPAATPPPDDTGDGSGDGTDASQVGL